MREDRMLDVIMRALEIDGQYMTKRKRDDAEAIKQVRQIGRKAGRRLGWKVRTFVSDRQFDSIIGVVVVEMPPEDAERFRQRGDTLVREWMASDGWSGEPG